MILSEDTRPFSFTSEEEQQIKDAYKEEEDEREKKEKTARIKVIRIKPSKVSQAAGSSEDRRQKGENEKDDDDDKAAEEESTAEFDLFADCKELAEDEEISDPEFGRNPFGFDLSEQEVAVEDQVVDHQDEKVEAQDQSNQNQTIKSLPSHRFI